MSTPHVTGVAALVWQSNPSLTGAQMRERLRRTAIPPTDGSARPNATWGYGKLNALRAVQNTVASISAPARATPGSPVLLTSENSSGASERRSPATSGRLRGPAWLPRTRPARRSRQPRPASIPCPSPPPRAGCPERIPDHPREYDPDGGLHRAPSDNTGRSVTFRGSASDADPQPLAFHWVLVSVRREAEPPSPPERGQRRLHTGRARDVRESAFARTTVWTTAP